MLRNQTLEKSCNEEIREGFHDCSGETEVKIQFKMRLGKQEPNFVQYFAMRIRNLKGYITETVGYKKQN